MAHIPILLDLDRHNYDLWKEYYTNHCEAYDAIDHIDDSTPKPTTPEWVKVDKVVKTWIYMTLSQNLANTVIKLNASARQLWLTIETRFRSNKDSRIMQLDTEIRSLSMGDLSTRAYCSKVQSIADLLENLDPNSKIEDKHLVIYTINGLSVRSCICVSESVCNPNVILHC